MRQHKTSEADRLDLSARRVRVVCAHLELSIRLCWWDRDVLILKMANFPLLVPNALKVRSFDSSHIPQSITATPFLRCNSSSASFRSSRNPMWSRWRSCWSVCWVWGVPLCTSRLSSALLLLSFSSHSALILLSLCSNSALILLLIPFSFCSHSALLLFSFCSYSALLLFSFCPSALILLSFCSPSALRWWDVLKSCCRRKNSDKNRTNSKRRCLLASAWLKASSSNC